MSFYHLPHPWNPGYAIPDYVMAEPPGRGTFTTKWLPRGTISEVIPDFLAKPGQKLLGRNNAGLGGLGSLGDTTLDGATVSIGGGHTLSEPTLAGDSLGLQKYQLESLGDGMTNAVLGVGIAGMLIPVALIGGAIWYFSRKKRRNPARRRRASSRRRGARRRRR